MPIAQVFHSNTLVMPFDDENKPSFPKDYHKVADVEATTLDEAYEKTNTISQPWVKNVGVKPVETTGCRSTSCGDVVELGRKYYFCEMFGWKEITPELPVSEAYMTKRKF